MKRKHTSSTLLSAVVLILILAQFFVFYRFWFTRIGAFTVYQDSLRPADAIFVLGGGKAERVLEGVALYRRHYGKKILFTGEYEPPIFADLTHWAYQARKLAVANGLPPEDAVLILESKSTYDDAVLARSWCRKDGITSLIIVSEPYHTRRAAYVFRKVFKDTGISVMIHPVQNSWYSPRSWWSTEEGFLCTANEYIKLLYYLFKGYL